MQYIWLALLWLLFGLLHSVFAATKFKVLVKASMKSNYRYYRPLYSLVATINLLAVVWYHYTITPQLLWHNSLIEKAAAIILAIPALIIMGISIKKYFMYLSGIDVFLKHNPVKHVHLEQTGLHKYVRHPLYFGTLLFVWCIFLWQPSVSNLISSCCITIYTIAGTYFEEKKLVAEFGEDYINYAKRVPMIVPGVILKNY